MNKQKLKGIRYILFAAFFFASMNLFVKMAGDLPVWQKCFSGIWWPDLLQSGCL